MAAFVWMALAVGVLVAWWSVINQALPGGDNTDMVVPALSTPANWPLYQVTPTPTQPATWQPAIIEP